MPNTIRVVIAMDRREKMRATTRAAAFLFLIATLPLAGLTAFGVDPVPYLHFSPVRLPINHPGFSLPAFTWLLLLGVAGGGILWRSGRSRIPPVGCSIPPNHGEKTSFPLWGWCFLVVGIACWALAWTRFQWFQPLQLYTFTPLWVSYIGLANAFAVRLRGSCLALDEPARFLALFPLSVVFWWGFEYLNRFVQNWHYFAAEHFSPTTYFLHASICFSTVLPAVCSTADVTGMIARKSRALPVWPRLTIPAEKSIAWLVLFAVGWTFFHIGVYPSILFPALWCGPLVGWLAWNQVVGNPISLGGIRNGCWDLVIRWSLAGMVCGFFWEMWNSLSEAKWEYSIPYFEVLHIFEMPLAGYAGYLPFGLECALVVDAVLGKHLLYSGSDPASLEAIVRSSGYRGLGRNDDITVSSVSR